MIEQHDADFDFVETRYFGRWPFAIGASLEAWRDFARTFVDGDPQIRAYNCVELFGVIASLAATVMAMREQKAAAAHAANVPPWAWVFSISTLVLGWIVVQTVFTLRYAHRYFGDGNADGKADGGVKFPGEPPKTYHDFIYMAVCIGASAQVSDFDLTNTRFRRLVTQHSLLAFFFNTMVLAFGINILGTLIAG